MPDLACHGNNFVRGVHIGFRAKEILDSKINSCGLYGKGKNKFKTARKLTKFVEHLIYQMFSRKTFSQSGKVIILFTQLMIKHLR